MNLCCTRACEPTEEAVAEVVEALRARLAEEDTALMARFGRTGQLRVDDITRLWGAT